MRGVKIYLILFLLLSVPSVSKCFAEEQKEIPGEILVLLDSLDAELSRQQQREAEHQSKTSALRRSFEATTNTEQRYWIANELYKANSNYDSDSALVYANICYEIAERRGLQNRMDDINLNRTYIYSATGLLTEAEECLAKVDVSRLEGKRMMEYYKTRLFYETHLDQFLGRNVERVYQQNVSDFLTELCRNLPADDPDYFWIMGWHSLEDTTRAMFLRPKLEAAMANSKHDTAEDAKNAWMIARLYELENNEEGMLHYLILSAIADARICNREIASLEEVGEIFIKGNYDLDRAYRYLSYSLECANSYKSRVRVGRLANLQNLAFKALNKRNIEHLESARKYMNTSLLISLVLVVALIIIARQMLHQQKMRRALSITTAELEERVGELKLTRDELQHANEELSTMYEESRRVSHQLAEFSNAKEEYIANLFAICSTYISKHESFRKDIYRMIMAKRNEEVFELVKSHEYSHREIKELYQNFDRIFLEIYPDFVKDYNTLLRPEEQIKLKSGELLNTELRIYALVRLGMTDSVKIAQFLHCSSQTVYNTRQRARNKAIVDRASFTDCVRALGSPMI